MSWEITLGAIFLMVGMTGSFSGAIALSDAKRYSMRFVLILITQALFLSLVIGGGILVARGIGVE